MRVLPYFLGAAAVVAVGGAAAGGAIDTTPRKIFDSTSSIPAGSGISFDSHRQQMAGADHYALDANGERYEVAELRERGLYSQDRYAQSRYQDDFDAGEGDAFDYAAAEAEQRQWEAEQRRSTLGQRVAYTEVRAAPARPLTPEKPGKVTRKAPIEFVSQPVVQDTSGMTRR
tara:strand:- start:763 stop:1278 length:516 start_codon:yes stop_codon:yes gene_type:complete